MDRYTPRANGPAHSGGPPERIQGFQEQTVPYPRNGMSHAMNGQPYPPPFGNQLDGHVELPPIRSHPADGMLQQVPDGTFDFVDQHIQQMQQNGAVWPQFPSAPASTHPRAALHVHPSAAGSQAAQYGPPPTPYKSYMAPGGASATLRTPVRTSASFDASLVHSATPPPPPAPSQPVKAAQPATAPAKKPGRKSQGAGGKSGVNRRKAGGSDDDIASTLTAADLETAGVKLREVKTTDDTPPASSRMTWGDEQALLVVQHVTCVDVWADFKLKQSMVFDQLVADFAKKQIRVTRSQIQGLWERTFRKYKQARRMLNVTGGAGDVEAPDINDSDVDVATKRKRGKKKDDENWSRQALLTFTETKIYKAIDEVAHDDPSVIRATVYSSAEAIDERPTKKSKKKARKTKKKKRKGSDSDSTSDSESDSDVGRSVLSIIKVRNTRQAEMDRENLELSKARGKREEDAAHFQRKQEEWRLEERERARVLAEKEQAREDERLRMAREKHEREEIAEYERCKASDDPVLQLRAKKIMERLMG